MAPGCPHLKITVCVRHLSKQKVFWCPRDATMLGWCALLSYLNPDAALAFPKLQEVSRGLFLILICFACISAFRQTVSQKVRSYLFLFCFLNLFFFFPYHRWFPALHMLKMAAGARTWFGTALLSQTRARCQSTHLQHSFFLSWVSFSCMGNPAPPHPEMLWYARFKEQNTVRAEHLVRVWRKEELGDLSTTFQSKSRVFWKKPTTFSSKLERGACHECRRSKAFSPMQDFSSRNMKMIQVRTWADYYAAACPACTSLGRAESHFGWGEASNLCCRCSRWHPAGSQTEPAASRAIASPSCRLPPVFVRGKARTLALQPFLSITRASPALFTAGKDGQLRGSSCNPVLAQRGLQTLAVPRGELSLPWGAVAGARQSPRSSATEAWVSPLLKTSKISKT